MRQIISRTEAKERGLKTFYTGVACRHDHISTRRTDTGRCSECQRESVRKWRTENPAKAREGWRQYREAHREERSEYSRRYHEANLEKERERYRRYKERHASTISAKARMNHITETTPLVDSILTTIFLLRTDQARQHYATWLLVLADYDIRVRIAVNHYQVDDFLRAYSGH